MSVQDQEHYYFRPYGFTPYGTPVQSQVPAGAVEYRKNTSTGFPQQSFQMMQAAVPAGTPVTPMGFPVPGALPPGRTEESYVENILRLNLGKVATIYMTYENNVEWNAKIFKGRLEAAGRDHIIISDPATGKRYLLLTVNLDYITFDEELNYFNTPGVPLPR